MRATGRDAAVVSGAEATRSGEHGYILVAVLFLVAIMMLVIAMAAPRVAADIRRDKERETVERGRQYVRAIRLYYKKFGKYPGTIDELEHTNDTRFLRKRYRDPMTGKDDWKLIHLGEAKVPPLGLFGQPLGISANQIPGATGIVPTGQNNSLNGQPSNGFGSQSSNSFGQSSSGFGNQSSSGFGNQSSSFGGQSPSGFGSQPSSGFGTQSSSGFGNDPSNPSNGQSPANPGSASGTPAAGTTPNGTGGSTTGTDGSNNPPQPTVVMGQIVGVGVPVDHPSILSYKGQKNYHLWEFVYNNLEERMMASSAGALGGNATNPVTNSGTGTPGFGTPGFGTQQPGSSTSGSGINNPQSPGFGASQNPTTPQPQ